jgi:hypothetical protein
MIRDINEKPRLAQLEIDLTGPDGNAFVLMGYATRLARELNLDGDKIIQDMKSGDYGNLLEVFDFYFGEHVILWR